MNFSFSFEIQYNDSSRQFGLIVVLILNCPFGLFGKSYFFILDSYIYVKFLFLNLIKFRYSAFHFVLKVHT